MKLRFVFILAFVASQVLFCIPAHADISQAERISKLEHQVKMQGEVIKILWRMINSRAGTDDPRPKEPSKELKRWLKD